MRKDLPIYRISIDLENPKTTVSFNSLVSNPAHEKSFQTFSKVQRYEFNDEKQIVTGVAISADFPIYRKQGNEEFYVVFDKQAISDIVVDYARKGNFNNLNVEHKSNDVVNNAFMVMLYQIDNEKGFTAPERFKDESDGSLLVSYKILDKEVYERAKNGELTGFSIEGDFVIEELMKETENEFLTQVIEDLKSMLK
jgi:hypothetical protein